MAVGDLVFKALTAGLGVATLYLAATFSVNVYRGLSWHNEQSVSKPPQISASLGSPCFIWRVLPPIPNQLGVPIQFATAYQTRSYFGPRLRIKGPFDLVSLFLSVSPTATV